MIEQQNAFLMGSGRGNEECCLSSRRLALILDLGGGVFSSLTLPIRLFLWLPLGLGDVVGSRLILLPVLAFKPRLGRALAILRTLTNYSHCGVLKLDCQWKL